MPDIVILTARYGHGHLTAAENIRRALADSYPDLSVEVVDPFLITNPGIYRFLQKLYRWVSIRVPLAWYWFFLIMDRTPLGEWMFLGNRDVARFFAGFPDRYRPRLVISTYPLYASALDRFHGSFPDRPFPILTVITDSVTINRLWLKGSTDAFLVADPLTARVLEEGGVPARRILVTGFPTPSRLVELAAAKIAARENRCQPESIEPARPLTILYLPNRGRKYLFKILRILGTRTNLKVILALGRRERLQAKVRQLTPRLQCSLEVLGWVPDICYRMLEADMVITKAGGATVHEALAVGCPVIICEVTPGQEEGNARLIESLGLGMVVKNSRGLYHLVKFFEQADFQMLDQLRENVARFRRGNASLWIATLAAKAAAAGPEAMLDYAHDHNRPTPVEHRPGNPAPDPGHPI